MQPPIPTGTILQGRYCLLRVLGQGGFGRTYLAADQGRYNEHCVIKEFIPDQKEDYVSQKSKELFQREAAILYQIQHPQIPQFRATFKQGRRLFFVQDYIQGKTYGKLLEERIAQSQTFSEAEVLHLLQHLLPVLNYIHGKGIIHRDISPDNIILRDSDRLPALIDFGVVKELVNQLQSTTDLVQGTTVGKLGYAPSEQLQTGKAYPSSDLYALAVTVIVLLTGYKPQDLLDETTMTWHWQQYVPALSPLLVQLLNRMLSARPNNRYQSATEVAQALRSLTGLVQPATSPTTTTAQTSQTVVQASHPPFDSAPGKPIHRPAQSNRNRLVWTLGLAALILLGFGPWFVIHSLLQDKSSQVVSTSPSPVAPAPSSPASPAIAASPSSIPTPTASASPTLEIETLLIPYGQTQVQTIALIGPEKTKRYLINVLEGQILSVRSIKGTASFNIRYPDGEPIQGAASVPSWQSAPTVRIGNYQIDVTSPQSGEVTLEIGVQTVAPSTVSPTPTLPSTLATPAPTVSPIPPITPTASPNSVLSTPTTSPTP